MACKYTYGNQVYDSLDDLKAAVKNDLQRSADKEDVVDNNNQSNTAEQSGDYESERVRKYYTNVLQDYKNQVAYLESDVPVKLHELRTKILDENFDRWRDSDENTYISHNFELLEKIKSDPKIDRETVSEFEKLYRNDLKIRQKNQALNSDNLDFFLNLPKNLKDQIRNSGINLDVPIGERVSKKKYLEAISKIENYLSSQQSNTITTKSDNISYKNNPTNLNTYLNYLGLKDIALNDAIFNAPVGAISKERVFLNTLQQIVENTPVLSAIDISEYVAKDKQKDLPDLKPLAQRIHALSMALSQNPSEKDLREYVKLNTELNAKIIELLTPHIKKVFGKDASIEYKTIRSVDPLYNPSQQLNTTVKPQGTINVYWGQAESSTSTKILSNLAPRKFKYKSSDGISREYGSVEHAYQTLKSGSFDQVTYDKYIRAGGYGTKITGKIANKATNLQLMKDLVVASFEQNSDSPAAKKLLQYEKFTHNTNEIIDQAFLEGLKLAQAKLLSSQQSNTTQQSSVPYYTGSITPEPNTIFVFGSNPEGRHGLGAAKVAKEQFGAKYGQGEGLQGNAYALPTKDLRITENNGFKSITPEQITANIKRLYEAARQNPSKQFKIAYNEPAGKRSLNGYTGFEMIEMFNNAGERPANIIFSKHWVDTGKLNLQQSKTEAKITDVEVEAMTKALVEMYPEIELSIENNPNFVDKEGVFNQQTNIKEGVPELFDSNPELANAVYEALGLKSKLSDIKPKVSITNYRNVTKQDKQNAVNGDIEAQKKWMIEEISEFYEAVDGFNNNTMSIDDVGEEVLGLFRTAQQFPEVKDFINPYIEDVQIALDNINKKEQYDKFKSKKTAKEQAEDMTFDNLFDVVNSFPNSKKQQALQLYSQYLDTIFPDSKVKDIVYHGSPKNKLEKIEGISFWTNESGTAYTYNIERNNDNSEGFVTSAIVNIKNPHIHQEDRDSRFATTTPKDLIDTAKSKNADGAIWKDVEDIGGKETQTVVFEPEQIHILGSKQDVQGFKEFAANQQNIFNQRTTEQDDVLPNDISFERVEAVSNMIMNKLAILGRPLTKRDFNKAKVDIFYKNDTAIKNALYMQMLTNIFDSSFASRVEGADPDAALESILNEDLKERFKSRLEELTNNNPYVKNKEALTELKQNYRLLESFMKHKDVEAINKYDEEQQKVIRLYLPEIYSPTKSMKFKTEKQKLIFLGNMMLKKMKMQIRTKESNLYNLMFRMRALTKKYETLIDFIDIVPNYKELITDKFNNAYDRVIAYKNKNIADESTNLKRNILFKAIYDEAAFMRQEFKLEEAAKSTPKKKNISALFPELADQNTVTTDVVTTLQRIVDGNGKFSALAETLLPYAEKNNVRLIVTDEYTGNDNTAAHYLVRTAQVVDKNTKEFLNDTVIDQYIEVDINSAGAIVQPEQLILHEITHSLTTVAIGSATFANNTAYTKLLDYIVKSINEHDVKTGGFMAMFSTPYGLKNPDELFAEALTNSEFQEVLKSIPPMDKKQFRNLFEEIVDFIASLFNIKEYSNVYEQLEEVIYATMNNQSEFAFSLEQLSKELDKNIDELEVVLKGDHNDRDMKQLNIQNQKIQKDGKSKIIGQADIQARKILIDAAFKNKPDLASHEFAHHYIAWFRNTPLVQQGIKMYGSEEALVEAIGKQAVVQKGKAWSWWKKFVAWLLNSANDVSDLTKENLRDILTDAFLSRQDLNKQAGTEAGVKLEKNVAVLGGETYLWNNNTGFWQPFTKSEADIEYSNDEMQRRMQEERDEKAQVKNDVVTKPAWKNNKRAALENRLLNIHKAIALHPVNAQNLLAPVSTVITKGIVKKLGIRAKHETRGAVIDPLSNINASIAMVQGKQGVGIVANAINTKAALTGVDAKLTSMYPVQSPLSTDEKHTQLPINLRMLGIEKVRYADGTLAYSLGKLADTFGNSIISNLSESLTQQVDNVKDPVAVELGYTLKTLGLTSYILTLGVPQEILAGLTAKGGIVTAWNDRVEENENLFHKGVVEQYSEFNDYAGEWRESTIRFEESNSTLKVEFIAALLRKEGVSSKYIETVVDENRKVKGYLLKHEALDADNVSLDKYDAVKLLFYWELIDQARAYGNTIKALTADTKTHKSIDAAAQQQLLIDQQLAGIDSIIDKDDISKVISSRTALKSNTKSVISPFFNMQRKYIEYFSKYFYTHDNGISSYLAANLKARYKLYSGDKLNRLISTAHNDFMIYLMTRMTAVNPNATSSLAKYNTKTAPLVEVDALLKHGEGLKMSAVNSIYNNLVLISKQPNLTTSRNYYYAQPTTLRNNSATELYQNITPEMARSLLDIFRFELGRVIKADVNVDNNTSIYLQNITSVDLIMFKDSAITTSAANNYIEIFEELRTLSPKLIQLFNSISLFQAGLNNSPYNLFKTLPITDLLSEDKSKSLVSNLATTIRTFDKLLPKKGAAYSVEADKRSDAIYNMVDDFLRWFDLQYGKIYVQPEAASKHNKASRLYKAFSSKDQKFIIYVKNDEGGGTPLTSVSSLTKNYLSTVPYTYAPTTTAVTNSNIITNDTINENAVVKQLESLGAFGDIIKAYVAAGGEIETLCS